MLCSPWGCKESDMTERLNWTELRDVGGSKPDHRYKLMTVFTSEVCGRSVGFKDMYLLDQDRLYQWLSKCDSWVAALTSPGNLLLLLSGFSCARLLVTPWTVAHQAPPYMGFSRQEYWSGLPFPSPGDLPDPRIEPRSPATSLPITLKWWTHSYFPRAVFCLFFLKNYQN